MSSERVKSPGNIPAVVPEAWVHLAVLCVPWALGLPVAWLLGGASELSREQFLMAPFVGLALLVLVLQNLVYLDLPVAITTPWVWALAACGWLAMLARTGVRRSLRRAPWAAAALGLLCYAFQGVALLRLGPSVWVGRLWDDQFAYTVTAEFLKDERFSLRLEDLGQRAYLFRVLRPPVGPYPVPFSLKDNRIGQSLLHAFLARSLGLDCKSVFGPLIVSGAALLAVALVLLAGRLGLPPPWGFVAAALGGLSPGLALLQLEGFLSHALVLGFFPVWLVALDDLAARWSPGRFAAAALVLSFGASDYQEMWPALVALALLWTLAEGYMNGGYPRRFAQAAGVVLLSLALNPGLLKSFFVWIRIASTQATQRALYPWAYSTEGLARLFAGDLARWPQGPLTLAAGDALSALLLGLGVAGLVRLVVRPLDPRARVLALGTLALALGAWPLRLTGQHPYQFYKTLLTGASAVAVGLAAWPALLTDRPLARRWSRLIPALALALATAGTLEMAWSTVGPESRPRHNAARLLDPDVQDAMARLFAMRNESIVLGPGAQQLINAWLTYAARNNQVWLATPLLARDRLRENPLARGLLDLTAAPLEALVVSTPGAPLAPPPGAVELFRNPGYAAWRPRPGPWARLIDVDGVAVGPLTLGRTPAVLHILSGARAVATLTLVRRAIGDPVTLDWTARNRSLTEQHRTSFAARAPLALRLEPGWNELRLSLVDGASVTLDPPRLELPPVAAVDQQPGV